MWNKIACWEFQYCKQLWSLLGVLHKGNWSNAQVTWNIVVCSHTVAVVVCQVFFDVPTHWSLRFSSFQSHSNIFLLFPLWANKPNLGQKFLGPLEVCYPFFRLSAGVPLYPFAISFVAKGFYCRYFSLLPWRDSWLSMKIWKGTGRLTPKRLLTSCCLPTTISEQRVWTFWSPWPDNDVGNLLWNILNDFLLKWNGTYIVSSLKAVSMHIIYFQNTNSAAIWDTRCRAPFQR